MRGLLRTAVYGIGATLLSGCYTYVPVERPAPRTPVRITVPVTSAVQNPNRAPESYTVDGLVVSSGDSLVLETETKTEFGAYRDVTRIDTLRVAQTSLLAVDERVFSTGRTIGLSVLIAGGTAALISGLLSVTTGNDGGGPGGGSPNAQISIDPIFGLFRLLGN